MMVPLYIKGFYLFGFNYTNIRFHTYGHSRVLNYSLSMPEDFYNTKKKFNILASLLWTIAGLFVIPVVYIRDLKSFLKL